MITVLVRVAKASRMIVIFRASHDDRFHRTPARRGTKRETGDPPVDGYKAVQTHQFRLLSACADSSTNRTNRDTDGVQSCPSRQNMLPPKESLIPGGRLICLVGQESQLECSPPGLDTFYTPNRHLSGTAQRLSLPQWISSSQEIKSRCLKGNTTEIKTKATRWKSIWGCHQHSPLRCRFGNC